MVSNQTLILDGVTLDSRNAVRNLGVIFHQDVSFKYAGLLSYICTISLKSETFCPRVMPKILVHFITSRLDFMVLGL